ncbi:MAG: chemotaxis protein CheW [Acidobacteriaceae bacterium]|jgi:purine-binding chemotaxis protein CheW
MKGAEESAKDSDDTVSLCSVRAGSELFGIETRQIREVLGASTPLRVPLAPEYIAGVVPYRGEVLTTVSLRALLGLEKGSPTGCVLVFDDEQNNERFGLLVDAIGGVATLARNTLEPNPSTLDASSMALFDGAYRMQPGLMVRLDPQRLRPSQLARNELFGAAKLGGEGPG